jgi:hypothetical protein
MRGWNVLLVTIDTLRADRVGAYGSPLGLTPTLDRLAREGVRFADAYAHVPLTLPSHATILTGAYPFANGVRDNGTFRLDPAKPTLAKALKTSGFRTGAFVGAFVLDARYGLNAGFDTYDDRLTTSGAALEVVQPPATSNQQPATSPQPPSPGSPGSTCTIRTNPTNLPSPIGRDTRPMRTMEKSHTSTPHSGRSWIACVPPTRSPERSSWLQPITAKRWAITANGHTACSRTTQHCGCR